MSNWRTDEDALQAIRKGIDALKRLTAEVQRLRRLLLLAAGDLDRLGREATARHLRDSIGGTVVSDPSPRPLIAWLGHQQEIKLAANDHKPDWQSQSLPYLLFRLLQEVAELGWAIITKAPAGEVDSESADVSNIAMMLADRYKGAAGSRNRGRNW